jgi:stage II sporulation protein GA (sporulation sigma-E factor processing peptidase)
LHETIYLYIDVIFLENFLMNYLLLYCVKRYCNYKTKWWKLPLASLIGTLYVFGIILIDIPNTISFFMKFIISIIMVYIAFTKKEIRKVVRSLILFYMVAFIICGSIFALFFLFKFDFQIVNGTYIIQGVKPWHLIGGSTIAILLIKLAFDFLEKYYKINNNMVNINIILEGKSCRLKALVDTGNSLSDPITHESVLIVYIESILDILPLELKNKFSSYNYDNNSIINELGDSTINHRIRLIPYRAIGISHGTLPAIRVDFIEVKLKNKNIVLKDAVIGLSIKPLSTLGDYEALAYPEIIKGGN